MGGLAIPAKWAGDYNPVMSTPFPALYSQRRFA